MAPIRPHQHVSDHTTPPRLGSSRPDTISTPLQRSPIKQRKMGINARQKQALIDNLQLELTERARRLRAQYNLQAQGLRSRIEIRINRIPMALRKLKMEDLVKKCAEREQRMAALTRPPPVPSKDATRTSPQKSTQHMLVPQRNARAMKRMSDQITVDKENEQENAEQPKKRARGPATTTASVRPAQVLSPTSSNSRLNNGRIPSPAKSHIAKPGSPLKGMSMTRVTPAKILSDLVEKTKSSRAAGVRKLTTVSTTSSSSAASASTRTRKTAAPKAPASRPGTRVGRRVSENSETSEGSTNTVVRKTAASKTAPVRKKVLGALAKSTTGGETKKAAAAKPAAPATTRTGRVLRNRAA